MYNTFLMKRSILILLMILLSVPLSYAAEEQLLDRVVAVVNDDVITQAELDAFLRPLYDDYSQQYSGDELIKLVQEARSKLLNQLIEDKLVYQEAVKQGLEVKEDEIDEEMESFKKRFGAPADIDSMLEQEGLSMKDFREKLKKQALIRKLQEQEIRSRVVVSPLDLGKFYQENPEKFRSTDRVKIRSLTIKKSAAAREKGIMDEKAKHSINELYLKIKQGEDFNAIVQKFSEDSRAKEAEPSEWIERGAMIESMDEVIFNTPVGQTTGIVETPIGYHVFKIEAKENARTYSLEESRNQIMSYLYQIKSNERFKEWMQALKRKAYISIQ